MTYSSLWCDVFQSAAAAEGGREGLQDGGACISSHCPWSSAPVKERTLMTEGPFVCDGQAGNDI